PAASDIYNKLSSWLWILDKSNAAKDNHELVILKTFQSTDAIIPTLSTELPICPKDKLT
ncbi:30738_t:CDS:1, partial [Racocetra persica]